MVIPQADHPRMVAAFAIETWNTEEHYGGYNFLQMNVNFPRKVRTTTALPYSNGPTSPFSDPIPKIQRE